MLSKRIRLERAVKVKYEEPENSVKDKLAKKPKAKKYVAKKTPISKPLENPEPPKLEKVEITEVQDEKPPVIEVQDEDLKEETKVQNEKSPVIEVQDSAQIEDSKEETIMITKKEHAKIITAFNKVAKENAKLKSQFDTRTNLAFINELQAKIARDDVLGENQNLQKTIQMLTLEKKHLDSLLAKRDQEIENMKFADFDTHLAKNQLQIEADNLRNDLIRTRTEKEKLSAILGADDQLRRVQNQLEKEFQRNAKLEGMNKKLGHKVHSLQGKFNLISQETKVHMHRTALKNSSKDTGETLQFCQYILNTISK